MISLIVATLNRTSELERLLTSLDGQTLRDFEVIIVDQNDDDRLIPIIERHRSLSIQRLHSERGLSLARNVGLPHAQGDIIAFPDDDCWYPSELLNRVREIFDSNPEYSALFTAMRDENHQTIGPKWPSEARFWTKEDVWVNGISPAGFIRREVARAIGFFDQRLGVGAPTPYQSGEDVDYFVRPLERSWKIWYDPALTVHHPSFHREDRINDKTYSYSLGGGYTLRAHRYPIRRLVVSLTRSFGGAVVYSLKGKFRIARSYLWRAAGLARGYVCGPRDLRKFDFLRR